MPHPKTSQFGCTLLVAGLSFVAWALPGLSAFARTTHSISRATTTPTSLAKGTASSTGGFTSGHWALTQSPEKFILQVGRFCLTSPKAKIDFENHLLEVTDTPACVSEMKRISQSWDKLPNSSVAALYVMSAARAAQLNEEIKRKVSEKTWSQTALLASGQACRCVVFSGPDSKRLAALSKHIVDHPSLAKDSSAR